MKLDSASFVKFSLLGILSPPTIIKLMKKFFKKHQLQEFHFSVIASCFDAFEIFSLHAPEDPLVIFFKMLDFPQTLHKVVQNLSENSSLKKYHD